MNKILVWIDGVAVVRDQMADDIADPAFALTSARASMVCSRMQGILALGETRWTKVLAYRATASWAEQIVIDDAGDWHRNSQQIDFFGYLLGMTDTDIDTAFTVAKGIVV